MPPRLPDEENQTSTFQPHYHDDFSSSEDDATVAPEATPLRPPSTEFEGLRNNTSSTWLSSTKNLIPPGVRKAWHSTKVWVQGPKPPRIYTITPFLPDLQHLPLTLLSRYAAKRKHQILLLLLLYAVYIVSFSLILHSSLSATRIPGYGPPVRLSCSARYWGEGNTCGIDGVDCRPFTNSSLAFRCPADCHKQITASHHAVGDQDIRYAAILVGGPSSTTPNNNNNNNSSNNNNIQENNAIYRSDSFICSAAIHSGYLPASTGGCGVLTLNGEQSSFTGSTHHGLTSLGFDSYFPHTFSFLASARTGKESSCRDLRWPGLFPTLIFTVLISLFTTSPAIFFWSIFPALFFHVALLSDPPSSQTTFPSLFSLALARFLPAAFCAWVIYRYITLRSLLNLTAQFEKTLLWLGAAWIGALNNYTFDRIPIQRLTAHDLRAQPGAIPALISIISAIFIIALGQAWSFRIEGRMPRYLALYGIFVGAILVALIVTTPLGGGEGGGLKVRIHHYVLGLVLLPGTSFQNRPSLLYQGLLVGLFVNGVARWGFASVLETEGSLLQGDHKGTLLPEVSVVGEISRGNVTFGLGRLPVWDGRKGTGILYDGVSVLVNDVERLRVFEEGEVEWNWERYGGIEGSVLPEYFRFAYMKGSEVGDYTKAGKWTEGGEWIEMGDGASK